MSAAAPVVDAEDVTRRYGAGETAVDALRGVSLTVSQGELVAVMGRKIEILKIKDNSYK